MLIEKIALTNFKSYGQATVHLRPGTTAIIGENGAGKSTLLEAIGFVLFDHRPDGFTLNGLLREGASSGSAIVRFRCGADSNCYEVERAFTATTTTRYRVYASDDNGDGVGAVLAEGNEDVTAWLHRHLDVDEEMVLRDLFANTIGVPQGTLTAPFLLAAGGRKQIFEPLLRVHEYRRASDALRETSRELETRSNTLAQ
jgi:DNA repair protein SbcC/Rad50